MYKLGRSIFNYTKSNEGLCDSEPRSLSSEKKSDCLS